MAQQDDNNDDELEDAMYKSTSDRLLFLIDVSAYTVGMEKSEQSLLCIHDALSVALSIMKGKVIADSTAMVGVLLYGQAFASESGDDVQIAGVYGLVPLAPPSAEHIRRLQDVVSSPGALAAALRVAIGPTSSSSKSYLREALWVCAQRFDGQKRKTLKFQDLHRVWIFTSEHNPSGGDPGAQEKILRKAQDCADNGIEVSLWCYERADGAFDVDLFYSKLLGMQVALFGGEVDMSTFLQRCGPAGCSASADGSNWGFKTQAVCVRRKESKKRPLCIVPMSFGVFDNRLSSANPSKQQQQQQSFINVQIYHLTKVAAKPAAVTLEMKSNEPVKAVTKLMSSEGLRVDKPDKEASSAPLSSSTSSAKAADAPFRDQHLHQFYDFAGVRIPFSKETLRDLKTRNNTPSVSILFFADRSVLNKTCHIEAPYFLFPDEKSIQGSSTLFASLLRDMSSKNLVACVKFVRSRQSQAHLGVLVPQEETFDTGGAQEHPAGFHMLVLPFLDDLRANPAPPIAHTLLNEAGADEQLATATAMIRRLMYSGGHPSPAVEAVESPSLQLFWAVLESLALGTPKPHWNTSLDALVPLIPAEELDLLPELSAFKEASKLLSDSELDAKYCGPAAGTKRKAASDALSIPFEPYREHTYEDFMHLTNDQLKGLCRGLGLPVGGKKEDLVSRLLTKAGK